jgi:CheY-like chemotaxis protein
MVPSRKHLLVVDDKPIVRDSLRMMLEHDGHTVVTAQSGKEALGLFDNGRFDVVFMDFSMPTMKGDELAAAIRGRVPKQPIVMITAYAEMQETSPELFAGADFVISKPFDMQNLRGTIAKLFPEPKQEI